MLGGHLYSKRLRFQLYAEKDKRSGGGTFAFNKITVQPTRGAIANVQGGNVRYSSH